MIELLFKSKFFLALLTMVFSATVGNTTENYLTMNPQIFEAIYPLDESVHNRSAVQDFLKISIGSDLLANNFSRSTDIYVRKNIHHTNISAKKFENTLLDSVEVQKIIFPKVRFTHCKEDSCQGAQDTPVGSDMKYDVFYQHISTPTDLAKLTIPPQLITPSQKSQIHSAFIQVAQNFNKIFTTAINIILVLKENNNTVTLLSYQIFLLQKHFIPNFVYKAKISATVNEQIEDFLAAMANLKPDRNPSSLKVQAEQNKKDPLLEERINQVLMESHQTLKKKRIDGKYWNSYSNLGNMYISQFLIFKSLLDTNVKDGRLKIKPTFWTTYFNSSKYKQALFESQQKDGSWEILHDRNSRKGDINATIYHYAALKILGVPWHDSVMLKAKNFILGRGGIEKSSQFTKIMMALTANASWSEIPSIPYILFNESFMINKKQFGQWIGPHILPIAYLRKMEYQKKLGPNFDLSELWIDRPLNLLVSTSSNLAVSSFKPGPSERDLIIQMLQNQKSYGSFGGYTLSTLFTMLAFDHYQQDANDLYSQLTAATIKGRDFVEALYFKSGDGSYLGITCDGSYWDTALIAQGLVDSGFERQELKPTIDFLMKVQDQKTGGFGFGKDFESFMDTDDTAEILTFMQKMNFSNAQTKKAVTWLFSMQNSDGGWGAFDKNNNGNFLLKIFGKSFEDSADLFDESSADVTGHVMESLALNGFNISNSEALQKAESYLQQEQVKEGPNTGAWEGRWGVNYIYGTSSAVIGLLKAGVLPQNEVIQKATSWLLKCQNNWDGGFGESFGSYTYPRAQACHGLSTPSQTAWALNALIEVGLGSTEVAKKAATYLVNSYNKEGNQWLDANTYVGTGHPKVVPMDYPSYPWAFSLMALGRYMRFARQPN